MKRKFLHTHPLSEPKDSPYPSFPPLPPLPVLTLHYANDQYATKRASDGLFEVITVGYTDREQLSTPTDDPTTAAMQGLADFSFSAAEIRNARDQHLGLMISLSDFILPAETLHDLAVLTALRLALEAGLTIEPPKGDKLYDSALNLLTTSKRKVYTSKLSKKTLEGKDVITQLLCAELNDEIFQLSERLDISRIKHPKIASKPRLKTSKEPKMPVKPTKSPDEEPRIKVEGSLTPNDLADEFETTPQRIRKALRHMYETSSELAHTHRQRWLWHPDYDADELEVVREELSRIFLRRGSK